MNGKRVTAVWVALACIVGWTSFEPAQASEVLPGQYRVAHAVPDSSSLPTAEDGGSRAGGATRLSIVATVVPVTAGIVVGLAGNGGTGQTVASATLLWGGAIVGPATGYWYGGAGRSATAGLVIRSAAFLIAAAAAPTEDTNDGFYPNPNTDNTEPWIVASAAILISDVIDLARVHGAVRRAESRTMTILPYLDGRDRTFGLAWSVGW